MSCFLFFQNSLPGGFWSAITRQVKTTAKTKRPRINENGKVCDTELIFSRTLALQATSRNIDFQTLLSHELAPFPVSLFDESGNMRLCSSKADLKSKTQVQISGRYVDSLDCLVLDGCAILWMVQCPSNSSHQQAQVKDFVYSFESYILHRLQDKEVYLVFDRYLEYSTKSCTRQARGVGGCKTFQLT